MMDIIANVIGICGVVSMLAAYFLLQKGTMSTHELRYLWMNFLGAVAVLFSLLWAWNWPAFLIELAWALISANSLIKLKYKKI